MAQNWSALSRLLTLWLWCAKWLRLLFKCIYMRQFNMNVFSASSRHIRCLLHCPVRVLFIFDTSCCRLRTSRQANKQTHAHSLSRTPINHMSDGCHSSVMFCVRGRVRSLWLPEQHRFLWNIFSHFPLPFEEYETFAFCIFIMRNLTFLGHPLSQHCPAVSQSFHIGILKAPR